MGPANKYDKKKKENQKDGDKETKEEILCCVPADKVYCQSPVIPCLSQAVKCSCSSGKCTKSGYMHSECFAKYEELIVSYMAKAGRGRTWNDKQRFANVWANKGYDLVFKSCVCDCGHGSLRKEVDWVPPKPQAEGANAAAPTPPEKKKKKEKTSLKPKLNFAVQTVQGSYYGSNNNRDEEEGEDKPAPSLPSMRAFVREHSLDTPTASSPPCIPGLALPSPKPKVESRCVERVSSQVLLPTPMSEVLDEPGWVTVTKTKERSSSGSRKNSIHTIKPREPSKRKISCGDNSNGAIGETQKARAEAAFLGMEDFTASDFSKESTPPIQDIRPNVMRNVKSPLEGLLGRRSPGHTPVTNYHALPMFQPQHSPSFSFPSYTAPPPSYYKGPGPFESSLQYHTPHNKDPPARLYSYESCKDTFGAGSKTEDKLSSSPEDIYQSDEEEIHRAVDDILKDSPQSTPRSITPKWDGISSSKGDADKEMDNMWKQTQKFDMELTNLKPLVEVAEPEVVEEKTVVYRDGKRDANGYIHCGSCSTMHQNTAEFSRHCRSDKHMENSIWAGKIQGENIKTDMKAGWEALGRSQDDDVSWDGMEQFGKDSSPSPLDGQMSQVLPVGSKTRSENAEVDASNKTEGSSEKTDSQQQSETARDEGTEILKRELEKEKAAKLKAQADVAALQSGKRLIEKQSLIVENTLKAEESKNKELKALVDKLSEQVKKKEFDSRSVLTDLEKTMTASEVEKDRLRVTELEETLAFTKEVNGKAVKKINEKLDKAEKVAQREKELRLIAKKDLELTEKQFSKEVQMRRNAEDDLKKALAKVKEAEDKLKEETKKRIARDVEIARLKDIVKAQEVVSNVNILKTTVDELSKTKEEAESIAEETKIEVREVLHTVVDSESCQMVLDETDKVIKENLIEMILDETDKFIKDNLIDEEENNVPMQISALETEKAFDVNDINALENCESNQIKALETDKPGNDPDEVKRMYDFISTFMANETPGLSDEGGEGEECVGGEADNSVSNDIPKFRDGWSPENFDLNVVERNETCTSSISDYENSLAARVVNIVSTSSDEDCDMKDSNISNGNATYVDSERNLVKDLFDELLTKKTKDFKASEDFDDNGWIALDDENVLDRMDGGNDNLKQELSFDDFRVEEELKPIKSSPFKDVNKVEHTDDYSSSEKDQQSDDSSIEKSDHNQNFKSENMTEEFERDDDNDGDRSRSPSTSDPDTESFNLSMSEDPDGLDRYPKLGLDDEISDYLGSRSVSRISSPEDLEDIVNEVGKKTDVKNIDILDNAAKPTEIDNCGNNKITPLNINSTENILPTSKYISSDPAEVQEPHSSEQIHSSSSSDEAVSPAWPQEMSDSSTSGIGSELKELIEDPGNRICCLESTVSDLHHMLVGLGSTVTNLSSQVDKGKSQNNLLMKNLEEMQKKNVWLERTVESIVSKNNHLEAVLDTMVGKHSLLERKISQNQLKAVQGVLETVQTDPDEFTGMKESLLELLASCETFQKGMDDMSDKQNNFDTQIKIVNDNVDEYKAENDDLKEEIETLGDKFSSLLLEYEVDKGSLKSQMENLMFNVSVLTTKLPMDTFAFSKESSTSGITSGLKSTDSSEMDTVSTPPPALSSPPPPSADSVKKIVSQLVFSNEAAAAADPKRNSCSPKVAEKPPSKPEPGGKPRKVLYNSGAVNHIPQGPPYPAITVPGNTNLWMSPDGGMVAIPPPTGPPVSTGSGSLSTRPPVPLPWPRGAMGQPYAGAPMMYPFNYPAVFYGPPR